MPGLIDSFIVELGLDPSQFDREAKDVAGRLAGFKRTTAAGAKAGEESLKALQDAFENMVRKMLVFAGSFIGVRAMVNFAQDTVKANVALGNMADTMGENVQRLSAMGNAFERMGGSAAGVNAVLDDWDRQIKAMSLSTLSPQNSKLIIWLTTLSNLGVKVSPVDAQDKFKKPFDLMVEVAEKIAAAPVPSDLKIGALLNLGFDRNTAAIVIQKGANIRQILKDQTGILAVTEDQRKQTDRLNTQLKTAEQLFKSLGQDVLIRFADSLDQLLNSVKKFVDWLDAKFSDPSSMLYSQTIADLKEKYTGRGLSGVTADEQQRSPPPSGSRAFDPNVPRSAGGSAGITAPAGTPIIRSGLATVTTSTGRTFQVDARFAKNWQGFIDDYEKAGGVIGPNSGTLGLRPGNPSGHPIGTAIDINQVSRDRRAGGKTLPIEVEEALIAKWGGVAGSQWRSNPDAGHFGIRSVTAARDALVANGISLDDANRITGLSGQAGNTRDPGAWPKTLPQPYIGGFKSPIQLRPVPQQNNIRTDINSLNVTSQGTDAAAIASDIAKELKRQMRETQPNPSIVTAKTPEQANAAMIAAEQARHGAGAP